jgi:hypothetical protein
MTPHICHATNCTVRVPRKMFMCKPHWFMLPKSMRDEVWWEYALGQENDWSLVTPEYLETTQRCIDFVAEREGHGSPSEETTP